MKKAVWQVGLAVLLMAAAGCVNVEYTGQRFPALNAGTPVAFYNADEPVPEGKYHAIGRAEVTAPADTNNEEIRKKLIQCALEQGADVVAVKEFKKVQTGYMQESGHVAAPEAAWRSDGRNLGGNYIYSNSFGEVAQEQKSEPVYEVRVKALFLVDNARFEEVVKSRRKEGRTLDEIAEEQAKNPATAATFEEMLKQRSTVTPEAAVAAQQPPAEPEKVPVKVELQNNAEPMAL